MLAAVRSRARSRRALQIVVNPLVNWIWLGFGILAFGTGIALLPERTYSFALAKLPAGAATTTVGAARGGAPARRRLDGLGADDWRRGDADVALRAHAVRAADAARDRLHVRHAATSAIAECRKDPCATSHEMRGELAALIDQGKSHDEIIQAFITSYGSQEMLGAPLDKGFNRLAWLFPYLVGATGAVAIGARRGAAGRAARERRGRRRRRRSIPTSTSVSTMSSETSTDRLDAAGKPPGGRPRPRPATLAVLRPRRARLRDGRDVPRARPGRHLPIILLSRADGGHRARRPRRRCARSGRSSAEQDDRTAMVGQRTRAALEREKTAGAAGDQGARVRSRDGEAVGGGLPGDVGPAARARRAPDAAARRRRRLSRADRTRPRQAPGQPRLPRTAEAPAARVCAACSNAATTRTRGSARPAGPGCEWAGQGGMGRNGGTGRTRGMGRWVRTLTLVACVFSLASAQLSRASSRCPIRSRCRAFRGRSTTCRPAASRSA